MVFKTKDIKNVFNSSSRASKKTAKAHLSVEELDARIRERAYYLAEKAGFPEGREMDLWLEAEKQIKEEL